MQLQFIELTIGTGTKCLVQIGKIKGVYISTNNKCVIDLGDGSEYYVDESYNDILEAIKLTCGLTQIKSN
jgi:prefoldin subunit 5